MNKFVRVLIKITICLLIVGSGLHIMFDMITTNDCDMNNTATFYNDDGTTNRKIMYCGDGTYFVTINENENE